MPILKNTAGLIGAAVISAITLPALANTTTEQVGTQSATINGNNNQIIQIINQTTIDHPGLGRGRTRNPARTSSTRQDSYQGVSVDGNGNEVYQETTQQNSVETGGRSRPAGRQNPDYQERDDDDDDDDNRGRGRHERDDDDDKDDDNRGRGRHERDDDDDADDDD